MGEAGDGMRRDHPGRNPEDAARFASNLRGIMRRREMTQMALSIRVGTTPGAVCLWCQGRSVPYATTLKRIALALRCTTDELLEGVGE